MAPTWLGPIRQSAFIVDDIRSGAMAWVEGHGVGPFFSFRVEVDNAVYRGDPTPMRGDMALAQSGVQQIELIVPDEDVPSIYTEYRDSGGTGLHHICYWADVDRFIDHFTGLGCELAQHGITDNGSRFAYVTGTADVPFIEVVDPQAATAKFFDMVAAAADGWDGADPVR